MSVKVNEEKESSPGDEGNSADRGRQSVIFLTGYSEAQGGQGGSKCAPANDDVNAPERRKSCGNRNREKSAPAAVLDRQQSISSSSRPK